MAPAHSPGGRAFSPVGSEQALDHPSAVSPKDPEDQGEGWRPIPGERKSGSHSAATRESPDPLRSTDRYRLVTPFKLKL